MPGVEPVQERVEVAELVRTVLEGVREQYKPEGDTSSAKLTVPENWFLLVRVTLELIVDPVLRLSVVEFEDIAKSWTVYVVLKE